jgi:predicted TIM-barrel fold metal-dependent hydrolase
MATIVDIYCHIFPDAFFQQMNRIAPRLGNIGARLRGVKKLFDLDERFREMDEFGDYRQIISLPNPPIEDLVAGAAGLELARIGNDAMAEMCARHPSRFPSFVAAVSLTDVEGSVREARRAVSELGAGGVQIFTNIAGKPLDDPAFAPIFAAMAELDRPIWLLPRAPPPCRIIRPSRDRASRCGGASVGPTILQWRWCGWCSQACSTATPASP